MGTVYRATDTNLNRDVAIKVLERNAFATSSAVGPPLLQGSGELRQTGIEGG